MNANNGLRFRAAVWRTKQACRCIFAHQKKGDASLDTKSELRAVGLVQIMAVMVAAGVVLACAAVAMLSPWGKLA